MEHSQQFVPNNDVILAEILFVEKEMLEKYAFSFPLQKQANLEGQHSSTFRKLKTEMGKIFSYLSFYLSK
jgi:hypothetical protein